MSLIRNGQFIRSLEAKHANGGTEYMAETLVKNVPVETLMGVDIWVSRVDISNFDYSQINILYAHDMGEDPMYDNINLSAFDLIVFVSAFQMASFANKRIIPYEKCRIIPNCTSIPLGFKEKTLKVDKEIKFIYHTTPHRGLEELVENFDFFVDCFPKAKLYVYSSFDLYGWKDADKKYSDLFDKIKKNRNMVYKGYKKREDLYKVLPDYDVFFYPCKWAETSCISLIEAAKAGLLCIVPQFSALGETSKYENIVIYNGNDYESLAERIKNDVFKDGVWKNKESTFPYHQEETFSMLWNRLIGSLKNG